MCNWMVAMNLIRLHFAVGCDLADRNRVFVEPPWRRFAVRSRIPSISYRQPQRDHSLHEQIEDFHGGGDDVEFRLEDQHVLQAAVCHVRSFDDSEHWALCRSETSFYVASSLRIRWFMIHFWICRLRDYDDIWKDLPYISSQWKRALLPINTSLDFGTSEAIYAVIKSNILEDVSPIVIMRAKKNDVERAGMRRAHIRDAVAMCDTLSYFEERVSLKARLFESSKF